MVGCLGTKLLSEGDGSQHKFAEPALKRANFAEQTPMFDGFLT